MSCLGFFPFFGLRSSQSCRTAARTHETGWRSVFSYCGFLENGLGFFLCAVPSQAPLWLGLCACPSYTATCRRLLVGTTEEVAESRARRTKAVPLRAALRLCRGGMVDRQSELRTFRFSLPTPLFASSLRRSRSLSR